MAPGHDSERMRNSGGAGIGSVTFWVGVVALVLFFGYFGWDFLFGG